MRKTWLFLIVVSTLIMSFPCFAEVADLKWGMTKEEALTAIELKGKQTDGPSPNESLLSFKKVPISMFSTTLELLFLDDQLVLKMYSINDDKLNAFKYLTKSLEAKYGRVSFDDEIALFVLNLADMYMIEEDLQERKESKDVVFRTWKTLDDTLICLVHFSSGSTTIIYSATEEHVPEKIMNTEGL